MYYEEHGRSKRPGDVTIVLCHGWLLDSTMWSAHVPALAALGRTVTIDGPGHGKSEVSKRYTLEEQADAVLELWSEIEIERAILVGFSWGGMMAVRLCVKHPNRVASLALIDTSASSAPFFARLQAPLVAWWMRRHGVSRSMYFKHLAPAAFGARTLRDAPRLVEELEPVVTGQSHEGAARALLAINRRSNVADEVAAVTAPTLILCGREDRMVPPPHSEALKAGIPHATLEWLDCGHMSPFEEPDSVRASLVSFVGKHMGGPRTIASSASP